MIFPRVDLNLLKIIFRPPSVKIREPEFPLLTPVSVFYGFGKDLMPNLDVEVGFSPETISTEKESKLSHQVKELQHINFTVNYIKILKMSSRSLVN